MKHNKFIKLMAVIMILAMTCVFLFACADDKKNEDENKQDDTEVVVPDTPSVTAGTVGNEIATAMMNSFDFNKESALGFEYGLDVPATDANYRINIKGYLDTATATNSRMYLDFYENNAKLFSLSADDTYMYFIGGGRKLRIRSFNMADLLNGANLPNKADIAKTPIGAVPSLLMSLAFSGDKFSTETVDSVKTNMVTGNLNTIATVLSDLVASFVPELQDPILNALSNIDTKMVAKINSNNKIDSIDLSLTKGENNSDLNVNLSFDSKFGNYKPSIQEISQSDVAFDETNLLNVSLNGEVNMVENNNYVDKTIATYTYEIVVDLDLFAMLKEIIVPAPLNVAGTSIPFIGIDDNKLIDYLANTNTGNIFFNLKHKCVDENCGCDKIAKGKINGSILSLAFSPEDFGNNEIYLSLNSNALIPSGLFESLGVDKGLAGTIGGVIKGNAQGQFGTNINVEALAKFIKKATAKDNGTAVAMYDGGERVALAEVPTEINFGGIIANALDFLSSITLDNNSDAGLQMGVRELTDLVYELNPLVDGVNLANIVSQFFGVADTMNINVLYSMYGDRDIAATDYKMEYLINDITNDTENVFKFASGKGAPMENIDILKDANGNPKINSGIIDLYGSDNKPLPVSALELKAGLDAGLIVKYSGTTISGKTVKNAGTSVIDIIGIDYNKVGEAQDVYLVTLPMDSNEDGTLGGVLSLASSMLGLKLPIPGEIIKTTITLAPNPTIELVAPAGGIDPNKEYAVDAPTVIAAAARTMDAKLTYTINGKKVEKVVKGIEAVNKDVFFDKTINALIAPNDFVLDYEYLGTTKAVTVKVVDNKVTLTDPSDIIEVNVGEEYVLPTEINFSNDALSAMGYSSYAKGSVALDNLHTDIELPKEAVLSETFEEFLGMRSFAGYGVTFSMPGKYVVKATANGGITKEFTFNVTKVLPDFGVTVAPATGKTTATITRPNYLGDEILSAGVRVFTQDETITKQPITEDYKTIDYTINRTEKELVYGEDYTLELDGVELTANEFDLELITYNPQRLIIKYTNTEYNPTDVKVVLEALDYNNIEIAANHTSGWKTADGTLVKFSAMTVKPTDIDEAKHKYTTTNLELGVGFKVTINDQPYEDNTTGVVLNLLEEQHIVITMVDESKSARFETHMLDANTNKDIVKTFDTKQLVYTADAVRDVAKNTLTFTLGGKNVDVLYARSIGFKLYSVDADGNETELKINTNYTLTIDGRKNTNQTIYNPKRDMTDKGNVIAYTFKDANAINGKFIFRIQDKSGIMPYPVICETVVDVVSD